jgi:hypothetical protein
LALVAAITITFGRVIGNIYYDLASSVFQKGQVQESLFTMNKLHHANQNKGQVQKSQVQDNKAASRIYKTLLDEKIALDAEIPIKLDRIYTLTGARIEGTSLVYVYRIEGDPIAVKGFPKEIIRNQLINWHCAEFKQALDMGASFKHEYFDSRGSPIATIAMSKNDCL